METNNREICPKCNLPIVIDMYDTIRANDNYCICEVEEEEEEEVAEK